MADVGRATWATVVIYALFAVLCPHAARAQADHHLVFRSLHTEHFDIHYHEPLGMLARDVAAKAEGIHARVSGALGLPLAQRVQVILVDNDDSANGLAGPLPYNAIRLRAVAPDDLSPLGDYDDWPSLLLTHEHTHIVHLEQARGLPRLIQRVFGRVYTPQQYLPAWFVEGLATVEETVHTTGGRGRDAIFDMYLRMDALENRVLGLDLIGFDGEPWPHGNVRYLYGQAFVGFIAQRHGQRAIGDFIREYGTRLVPFGINRAMKRATGETVVELYDAFTRDLKMRSEVKAEEVRARGVIEGTRLSTHGEVARTPRFLDDDHLVYAVVDGRHVTELRKIDLPRPQSSRPLPQNRAVRLTRTTTPANASKVPQEDLLIFSAGDYHRGTYFFSDLFSIKRDGSGRKRLTHGLRAREPDVSPDGKFVAYALHGAGTSHLEIAELSDIAGTRRPLVQSQRLDQIYTPRFSPDGKRVAYSAWSRGGYRDIWIVDVATGERWRLTNDRALDRGPVFSPDGKRLYFSSDRTGIANLYAYEFASGSFRQITNVLGGAFQPDVSPNGRSIVYVGYTSKGFDLYQLALDEARTLDALPSFERPATRAFEEPLSAASTPYDPLPTLWPRTWDASVDEGVDESRLVLSTYGRDAVGMHAWSLSTVVGLESGALAIATGYSYLRPRFPVLVSATLARRERNDLIVNDRARAWQAMSYGLSVGTSIRIPYGIYGLSFRPDYSINRVDKTEDFYVPVDPNYPPPRFPALGNDARLSLTIRHANSQRQPYDVSESFGHTITVRPSLRNRRFGSREDDLGVSYRLEQFVRLDVREAVLALAYTGAFNLFTTIGGFPAQIAPIFDVVTGSAPAPADIARLRGFPGRSGTTLHVVQLELRALAFRINKGFDTLPVFARRVHFAIFSDAGNVYDRRFLLNDVSVGVGGELRFDASTTYGEELTFRLGLAQGLTRGGELQWYTSLARPW